MMMRTMSRGRVEQKIFKSFQEINLVWLSVTCTLTHVHDSSWGGGIYLEVIIGHENIGGLI